MDANKLKKLVEIKYVIHNTCQRCIYSDFPNGFTDWGQCCLHTYSHEKHNEEESFLSINRSGNCPSFEESQMENIRAWNQFLGD